MSAYEQMRQSLLNNKVYTPDKKKLMLDDLDRRYGKLAGNGLPPLRALPSALRLSASLPSLELPSVPGPTSVASIAVQMQPAQTAMPSAPTHTPQPSVPTNMAQPWQSPAPSVPTETGQPAYPTQSANTVQPTRTVQPPYTVQPSYTAQPAYPIQPPRHNGIQAEANSFTWPSVPTKPAGTAAAPQAGPSGSPYSSPYSPNLPYQDWLTQTRLDALDRVAADFLAKNSPTSGRKPFYVDETIEPKPDDNSFPMPDIDDSGILDWMKAREEEKKAEYAAKRRALQSDWYLPYDIREKQLADLDEKYGYTQKMLDDEAIRDKSATTLSDKVADMNELKSQINDLRRRHEPEEYIVSLQNELDSMINEFGDVPGLHDGIIDPSRVTDIKLDGKAVENARYIDGVATGNLYDVVRGLGGRVTWNKNNTVASVYNNEKNLIYEITIERDNAIVRNSNGRLVDKYAVEDGHIQADIHGIADALGVPYNYYHDKNGVYRAYARPEMKDAPIQVVRNEDEVIIKAYVEFSGDIDGKFPGTDYTYAEVAYAGIMNNWNTNKSYNIGGQDANGQYVTDDEVKVKVELYTKTPSPNNVMKPIEGDHKTVKININNDWFSSLPTKFNFTSHVFTESPFEALWNPIERVKIAYNAGKALGSGEYEQTLYNWSIQNPGEMTLYSGSNGNHDSRVGYSETAAHEFGHLLGLGDAYSAFYRNNLSAPFIYDDLNEYNVLSKHNIPDQDIMRSNEYYANQGKLTENDVRLLMKAWESGESQFFPKR